MNKSMDVETEWRINVCVRAISQGQKQRRQGCLTLLYIVYAIQSPVVYYKNL